MLVKSVLEYLPIQYHTAFKILASELGDFTNFNLMANEIAEEFLNCIDKKMTMSEMIEYFKTSIKKES